MSFPVSFPSYRFKPHTRHFISYWALLLLGTALGIGAAYLLVIGQWQFALVFILILPTTILLLKYPLFSLMVWLLLDPFLMTTPTASERMVYWMIHRALPPATVGLIILSYFLRIRELPKISLAEVAMIAYLMLSLSSIVLLNKRPLATTYLFYDRVFSTMCLYLVIRFSRPNVKDLQRFVPIILFLGLSQAVIGLLSWSAPQLLREEWLRLAGSRTTGSLDSYSVYTTTMIFTGLVVLHAAMNRKPGLLRIALISVFIISVYCVFISFSRGSWLAGVIILLGLIYLYPKFMIPWLFIVVPTAFLVIGGIFADKFQFAVERLNSSETALSRLPVSYASIRLFEVKPLFGWGYGNFGEYDRQFQGRVGNLVNAEKDEASHNLYLALLAEQGIFGFLLFLTPPLWWLIQFFKAVRKMPKEGIFSRKLILLFWLVILYHFIVNNFSHMLIVFGLGMWWVTLGFIASMVDSYSDTQKKGS